MVQLYDIRLAILAQQLQLTPLPDGRRRANLEIAVYAYAADGQKLGGTKQNLEASMPPGVYAQALQDGMFHNLQVALPWKRRACGWPLWTRGISAPVRWKWRCRCRPASRPMLPSQQPRRIR